MVTYEIEETMQDKEMGKRKAYGINAYCKETGKLLLSVPDVFIYKCEAEQFVILCNKNELSPIHLLDVISDTIS